jgi:ankyrin repeat protein
MSNKLLHAAKTGDVALALTFLNAHSAIVTSRDNDGQTPLHIAAQHGHIALIDLLVSHGARVTDIDGEKSIPLHKATQNNQVETVKELLRRRSNPSKRDKDG